MKKVVDFKYIIGLGNPGEEYRRTRHNTGFMFVDYLLQEFEEILIKKKKMKHGIVIEAERKFVFIRPQKYMNKSGEAAREAVKRYEIDIEQDLLLVHDDLDISLGRYKLQFAKSSKSHNGVISVEKNLGTTHFHRLRIGSDNRGEKNIDGQKYVLQKYTEEELVELREVFAEIVK